MSIPNNPSFPVSSSSINSAGGMLLTLNQAALELAISRRTLSRLIVNGTFPSPLKIGRASRISREDLAAFLEKLCRERGDKLGTS